MAVIGIDELNTPREFDSEEYIENYFKPMPISEERKEERKDAARDFRDVLLFILSLIAVENQYNALNWAYIEEQFRKELEKAALKYARSSQALQDYIAEKTADFMGITRDNDLDDPYWTSDERATKEAVTESNAIIGMKEWQQAIEDGAVKKRWLTQNDSRVRDSHDKVNGREIGINRLFVLDYGTVRYPGDEYYSKKESCGCRCGLEFLDKDGNVVGMMWTKRGSLLNGAFVANSAYPIYTIESLKEVSNSSIIGMESYEEIVSYFKTEHRIDLIGFDKCEMEGLKATLSGYDDLLTEFPQAKRGLNTIKYVSQQKRYGKYNSRTKVSTISPEGAKSYGTGYHEAAHSLDYVRKPVGEPYSKGIIEQARMNLGYAADSRKFREKILKLVGHNDYIEDWREIFACAMETARAGDSMDVSDEIYRLVKEGWQ